MGEADRYFVVCDFWEEDGVWNGSARGLAAVVFGDTLAEAMDYMKDTLESHFEAHKRHGEMDLLSDFREAARPRGPRCFVTPGHLLASFPVFPPRALQQLEVESHA